MPTPTRPTELGEFLRARRDATAPADVGLAVESRRRVPGLRREELASLARVSSDYYTRVEQGRVTPSPDVIDAIAAALRLEPDARRHLRTLASPWPSRLSSSLRVTRGMARLIELLGNSAAAHLVGPRLEVPAYNRLAEELIYPFSTLAPAERNLARIVFLDEAYHRIHRDWSTSAGPLVGWLRASFARAPDDPELNALTRDLSERSQRFAELWSGHHTRHDPTGKQRFVHPAVGELVLDYEAMSLVDDSELVLITFSAAPGTPDEAALRAIAATVTAAADPAGRDGETGQDRSWAGDASA